MPFCREGVHTYMRCVPRDAPVSPICTESVFSMCGGKENFETGLPVVSAYICITTICLPACLPACLLVSPVHIHSVATAGCCYHAAVAGLPPMECCVWIIIFSPREAPWVEAPGFKLMAGGDGIFRGMFKFLEQRLTRLCTVSTLFTLPRYLLLCSLPTYIRYTYVILTYN